MKFALVTVASLTYGEILSGVLDKQFSGECHGYLLIISLHRFR